MPPLERVQKDAARVGGEGASTMWELLLVMLERLGIIVTVAFVMTRFSFVRRIIDQKDVTRGQWIRTAIMFGLFGIIGTYTGLTVHTEVGQFSSWTLSLNEDEAIANSRVIGIVVAGLLGGWKVGATAGLIAGAHRLTLGGFSAFACGLSTIVAGLIAGYVYKRNKNRRMISWQTALVVGMIAEAVQMIIILGIARPFTLAWQLVSSIGIPMVLANGIGTALFILIIRNVIQEEEKIGTLQAQRALRLADQTLKHMRKGLSHQSAKSTCTIILKEIDVAAVSITNEREVLAYVGMAEDRYADNRGIKTEATKQVLKTGVLMHASEADLTYYGKHFPLKAAIIAPLKQNNKTVGTLKFYFQSEKERTETNIELSRGLAKLLSHQLELAEMDRHLELAKQAEIKALQAQVNPHFLFNAINTIVSLVRTDPIKARKLLLSLSKFFRQNLAGGNQTRSTLAEELSHVRAYLAIEETRFTDRLRVIYDIDESVLQAVVPPMTLQPFVENAMKHGLKDQVEACELAIMICRSERGILITIRDNGVGISEGRMQELLTSPVLSEKGTGIGLYNVKRRLEMMYGDNVLLQVKSKQRVGTTFTIELFEGEGNGSVNSHPNDHS